MKLRNRELNIFSMSALDLFASALGAFILLTVIALPFFANTYFLDDETLLGKLSDLQKQLEKTQTDLEQEKDRREKAEQERDEAKAALEEEKRRTALLGIETSARQITLLVDMSGSMNQTTGDFRPVMTQAIRQILDSLDPSTELAVIGFHAPNEPAISLPSWPTTGFASLATNRPAFEEQIARMMNAVEGGTPTLGALMAALERTPGAIIVLTDGAPTVPDEDWSQVVEQVSATNGGAAEIHAVAIGPFWQKRDFVEFLTQLTARNGGSLTAAVH